jgi:hypothetical protein
MRDRPADQGKGIGHCERILRPPLHTSNRATWADWARYTRCSQIRIPRSEPEVGFWEICRRQLAEWLSFPFLQGDVLNRNEAGRDSRRELRVGFGGDAAKAAQNPPSLSALQLPEPMRSQDSPLSCPQIGVFAAAAGGADVTDTFAPAAVSGINVNGLASTPYNVAVDGTDFAGRLLRHQLHLLESHEASRLRLSPLAYPGFR